MDELSDYQSNFHQKNNQQQTQKQRLSQYDDQFGPWRITNSINFKSFDLRQSYNNQEVFKVNKKNQKLQYMSFDTNNNEGDYTRYNLIENNNNNNNNNSSNIVQQNFISLSPLQQNKQSKLEQIYAKKSILNLNLSLNNSKSPKVLDRQQIISERYAKNKRPSPDQQQLIMNNNQYANGNHILNISDQNLEENNFCKEEESNEFITPKRRKISNNLLLERINSIEKKIIMNENLNNTINHNNVAQYQRKSFLMSQCNASMKDNRYEKEESYQIFQPNTNKNNKFLYQQQNQNLKRKYKNSKKNQLNVQQLIENSSLNESLQQNELQETQNNILYYQSERKHYKNANLTQIYDKDQQQDNQQHYKNNFILNKKDFSHKIPQYLDSLKKITEETEIRIQQQVKNNQNTQNNTIKKEIIKQQQQKKKHLDLTQYQNDKNTFFNILIDQYNNNDEATFKQLPQIFRGQANKQQLQEEFRQMFEKVKNYQPKLSQPQQTSAFKVVPEILTEKQQLSKLKKKKKKYDKTQQHNSNKNNLTQFPQYYQTKDSQKYDVNKLLQNMYKPPSQS